MKCTGHVEKRTDTYHNRTENTAIPVKPHTSSSKRIVVLSSYKPKQNFCINKYIYMYNELHVQLR